MNSASDSPFPVDEDRWFKMRSKTGFIIVSFVIAATGYCLSLKYDVGRHTEQLKDVADQQAAINKKIENDHDLLVEVRSVQREQGVMLKYLAEGRRGPVPAATINSP